MEQKIDLFTPIHKAIRALIYDTGIKLQRTDFSSEVESNKFLTHLERVLDLLEEHARHEDQIIFPPIEKASPGICGELEKEHEYGEKLLLSLRKVISELELLDGVARNSRSNSLNRTYTDFISFYLSHMNREEETVLPVSKNTLTNNELASIRLKVQIDTRPGQYTEWLRWMLPALNIRELVPLFQQIKASAPSAIYQQVVRIGEEVIDSQRWNTILREAVDLIEDRHNIELG
ncbi:MAG: hypothetical protein HKN76_07825 [Saprospiraceae bacterium]|nr:hypothetical protein [Saprospiraceae bacterium]